jgi:hypothetical protein
VRSSAGCGANVCLYKYDREKKVGWGALEQFAKQQSWGATMSRNATHPTHPFPLVRVLVASRVSELQVLHRSEQAGGVFHLCLLSSGSMGEQGEGVLRQKPWQGCAEARAMKCEKERKREREKEREGTIRDGGQLKR